MAASSSRKRAPVPSDDDGDEDMSEVKTIGRRPLLDGQAQTSWLEWRAMGLTWEQGLRRMADRNDPQLSLARNLYQVDHALRACRHQTLEEILHVARTICAASQEEDAAFFAYADSRLLEGLSWYVQQVGAPPLDTTDFDQAGQGDLVWAMDRREDDQLVGLVDLIHRGYGTTWWYLEQAKLTHRERQACAEAEREPKTLLHCIQRHEWPTVDRLLFQITPDPSILVALMEAEGAAHIPLQNPNRDARMQRTFQLLRTYPSVRLTAAEAALAEQADRPLLNFTRSGLLLWLVKAGPQYQWTLRYAIARGLVIRTDEDVLAIVSTPVLDWPLIGVLTRQADPKLDLGRIISPNRMLKLEAAALQAFRTTGNSIPRETLTALVMEWRTQRNHTTESPLVMETDDEVSDHDSQRTVSEDDMDQ